MAFLPVTWRVTKAGLAAEASTEATMAAEAVGQRSGWSACG